METVKTELNQQPPNEEIEQQMFIPDFLGKPRGPGSGPSYSPVWNYFVLDDDNPILATCLICGIRMSRGGVTPNRCGTTNLRRHLSYAHGLILPSKRRNAWAGQTGPSSVTSLTQSQTSSSTSSLSSTTTTSSQVYTPLVMSQRTQPRPILPKKQPNQYYQPSNQSKSKVRLRWNSYYSNMQAVFPSLLYSEQFVDVTLACEGKSIKCHKVMLSACSSYFEDLLTHNPCKHPIILMKDLRFWEVQALVDFMYNGEVNVQEDKLPSLLAAAEALQIKGLTGPSNNPSVDGEAEEEESVPSENCTPVIDDKPTYKSAPLSKKSRKRKAATLVSNQNDSNSDDHKMQSDADEKVNPNSPVLMETVIKEEPVDTDLLDEQHNCEVIEHEVYAEGPSSYNNSDNHIDEEKTEPSEYLNEHSNQKKNRSQRENSKTVKVKGNSVSLKAESPVKSEPKSKFPRLRFVVNDGSSAYGDDDDNGGGDNNKSKRLVKRIQRDSVSDDSGDD